MIYNQLPPAAVNICNSALNDSINRYILWAYILSILFKMQTAKLQCYYLLEHYVSQYHTTPMNIPITLFTVCYDSYP